MYVCMNIVIEFLIRFITEFNVFCNVCMHVCVYIGAISYAYCIEWWWPGFTMRMSKCIYVCMYVCICMYVYMYEYLYVYVCMGDDLTWLDHEDVGPFGLVQSSLDQRLSTIGGILFFIANTCSLFTLHTYTYIHIYILKILLLVHIHICMHTFKAKIIHK